MKKSKASSNDYKTLRDALSNLPPGAAHQANAPPKLGEIFAPATHANALDPQRSLVIGNRGVGKSFWSAVLTHDETRNKVAIAYPRLPIKQIRATLGFHEAAGKDEGPAPSPAALAQLQKQGYEPETIWRAVLINALRKKINEALPTSTKDIIAWMQADVERTEAALRQADRSFLEDKKIFLLVFDALDRLGKDWETITPLTRGILRLALDMRGFRAMKAKVFIRTDQSKDDTLFRFADASKLRSDAVSLVWRRGELFGLLYNHLLKESGSRDALARFAGYEAVQDISDELLNDEGLQEELFYRLAGEFMGAGPKRGRTYNWLYDHLADTFGETSPRSFVTALQRAADYRPAPKDSVIDHNGIRAGVQDASRVRVTQLKEDYDWIDKVMGALDGLEVPCDPSIFLRRWTERKTVSDLQAGAKGATSRLPLELANSTDASEEALLRALANIGVIEFRTESRINMPDIFRVEAGIKRRGGVRPPSARRS
ncbi:hypothetical protein [Shinella sp. NM-101]|uniref:hypothetical protein n=1 Tax=Shinella sp. NM-101 TaxID=2744455 RepID=UPI001F1D6F0D|nr:hypothetical protein [Shinella sp. NM-101]